MPCLPSSPINCPDVVALIEAMANKFTSGNKTEAVALAMRRPRDQEERKGSLFGVLRGSARVREGVDLTAPILDEPDHAETGRELAHK